ncbi:hypothetical protein HOY82DRAFT_623320 [Tuber indicum]|nr:hypothetical protein HOY82DRAFT_623320 [Tuber indicum]
MFYRSTESVTIHLPPKLFHCYYMRALIDILYSYEGKTSANNSTLIAVTQIFDISGGRIPPSGNDIRTDGGADFTITFEALMFHAFPGEVMFGTVVGTSPLGVFLMCGAAMRVFVSVALCAEGITWDGKKENKSRVPKRPLREEEREGEGEEGEDEEGGGGEGISRSIRVGDGVLVRLTAVSRDGDKLHGVGDMSGDYTGFASRSYSVSASVSTAPSYPIETLNLPVANGINHPCY